MSWKPTNAAWGMLGGATVLLAAATVVAVGGVRSWLRQTSAQEAFHEYFRTAEQGTSGLETMNTALDRAPGEPSLTLLKASMLATREREQDRAIDLFAEAAKLARGDEDERRWAGLAKVGGAIVELTRARRAGTQTERRAAWERALEAAEAARKLLPRRMEPYALTAAVMVERGEAKRAADVFESAGSASEPATRGGLLTLYAARAEAARQAGDYTGEAEALMRAIHLAPPSSKGTAAAEAAAAMAPTDLRARLGRAVARRTADTHLQGEAIRKAVDEATLFLLPLHPLERYHKAPLYGLDPDRLAIVKEAMGAALARAGQLEGARRTLEDALKEPSMSGNPGLSRQLAGVNALACRAETNLAARKGLARKASDTIAEAADRTKAVGREGYELYLAAAVYARDADLLEQSQRLCERALKCAPAAPGDARVDRCLGVVYDQWGRVPSALEAYRKALAKAPGDPDAAAIESRIAVLEAKRGR